MAYLSKQQYDRRRENAAQRAIDNEAQAQQNGMTAEQAELISRLCSLRHDLHTNMDEVTKTDDNMIKRDLVNLNSEIAASGLPYVECIPTETEDFIDIDTIDGLYDYGDVPKDDAERKQWYEENYERIYKELEDLNTNIEHYLADIDKQYNTHYAPTGALRNF